MTYINDCGLNEKLNLENEQLTDPSKEKNELLTTISHELCNPLNSIIGFSSLLKQNKTGKLNKKQKQFVDTIFKNANYLYNLSNDISDVTMIETGKLELVIKEISVSAIIDETITLLKEIASKQNILITKEIDPEIDIIEADYQRLKQIFYNLTGNIVRFSCPKGGYVTIKAKKADRMVEFSISFTGIGIQEDEWERLLSIFHGSKSSEKYEGSGFGLVLSKKLVELHGGSITIEKTSGKRNTLKFFLPQKMKKKVG